PGGQEGGRGAGGAAGDHQGGLGQPVAGVEGLAAEAGRGEGVGEAAQGCGAYRFGTVEGDLPVAEVEPFDEAGAGVPEGEFVGEVVAAAGVRVVVADGVVPALGPLEELQRGVYGSGAARVHRVDDGTDDAHVEA